MNSSGSRYNQRILWTSGGCTDREALVGCFSVLIMILYHVQWKLAMLATSGYLQSRPPYTGGQFTETKNWRCNCHTCKRDQSADRHRWSNGTAGTYHCPFMVMGQLTGEHRNLLSILVEKGSSLIVQVTVLLMNEDFDPKNYKSLHIS